MTNTSAQNFQAVIVRDLNEIQARAALHDVDPLVVFAGAGSGKTRILTYRIAYLLSRGIPAQQILALTFTNKAAREMQERALSLIPVASRCHIATFHSACARWLREFSLQLGFSPQFTIYDDKDSELAVKTVLERFDVKNFDTRSVQLYSQFIDYAKQIGLFPEDREQLLRLDPPPGGIEIYLQYQSFLKACNAMDFSDLLMHTVKLLRENSDVRNYLNHRYRYILVDEFQDTNRWQFDILLALTQSHKNLFVVGDDDQSIYSWRGADPSTILGFEQHFPTAEKIILAQNYRSTSNIVQAANSLIVHNEKRASKDLWTQNPEGEKIKFDVYADPEIEAYETAAKISDELGQFSPSECAIFYRTNSQSRLIEDALRSQGIPYRIFGSVRFFDRLEIRDLIAYVRIILHEDDDIALKRIINVPPRRIGDKVLSILETNAAVMKLSLVKTMRSLRRDNNLAKPLCEFLAVLDQLKIAVETREILNHILAHTKYLEYLNSRYPKDFEDRAENIQELQVSLFDFLAKTPDGSISDWLESLALDRTANDSGLGVSMMTLHIAKGLEFRRVYIVGLEDGLLPHNNSIKSKAKLEEERRLLYVGITRAREKLSMSYCLRRRIGQTFMFQRASRFLGEIPPKFFALNESGFENLPQETTADGVYYDFTTI